MEKPELVFVAGCNAAGKSSFIRSRLSDVDDFEIIVTDVHKGRTKEVFQNALDQRKNIVLETVFNDSSFSELIDKTRNSGYLTSLIILFLVMIYELGEDLFIYQGYFLQKSFIISRR